MGKLLATPPVGMDERASGVDIGVHRLSGPCYSAPLLCLRMRRLSQQYLKPDKKLNHFSLLFEASVVLGVLGWGL